MTEILPTAGVGVGVGSPGGMTGYPSGRIYEEVAFIAYHFHWPHDDIMAMDHRERQKWVEEISRINRKISGDTEWDIREVL